MESAKQKSGKCEKSKYSSLKSHVSFRGKINEIFFLSATIHQPIYWKDRRCSTHRSLIGMEKQIRVQRVPRTENPFRWDGKVWLGQDPSPFSRNPSGSQPQHSGMLSPAPEGWGLSYPGCLSPGSTEGFPLQPFSSFPASLERLQHGL